MIQAVAASIALRVVFLVIAGANYGRVYRLPLWSPDREAQSLFAAVWLVFAVILLGARI